MYFPDLESGPSLKLRCGSFKHGVGCIQRTSEGGPLNTKLQLTLGFITLGKLLNISVFQTPSQQDTDHSLTESLQGSQTIKKGAKHSISKCSVNDNHDSLLMSSFSTL